MGLYDDDLDELKKSGAYHNAKSCFDELINAKELSIGALQSTLNSFDTLKSEFSFVEDTDINFKGWLKDCRDAARKLRHTCGDSDEWNKFAASRPDFVKTLDRKEGFSEMEVLNGRFGFSFFYPEGWLTNSDGSHWASVKPEKEGEGHLHAMMEALPVVPAMEAFAGYSLDKLRHQMPGCNVVGRKFVQVDGVDAYEIIFTYTTDGDSMKGMKVFVVKGNSACTLTYVSPDDNYDKLLPSMSEIIDSFNIIGYS